MFHRADSQWISLDFHVVFNFSARATYNSGQVSSLGQPSESFYVSP